ncbi:unnamed protein product [Arctogadus glacialis]
MRRSPPHEELGALQVFSGTMDSRGGGSKHYRSVLLEGGWPLRSTAIHTSKLLPVPPFDNGAGYCCCSVVIRIMGLVYGRMARL